MEKGNSNGLTGRVMTESSKTITLTDKGLIYGPMGGGTKESGRTT